MLTCICPGMSSANHTLNSLRYAERLKDKGMSSVSRGSKAPKQEDVMADLRQFMEKHGKSLSNKANTRALEDMPMDRTPDQNDGRDGLQNMFYQDERLDQVMEDGDDEMLNDEQNELLMQQEMEDDIAIMQVSKNQVSQKSASSSNQRGKNAP